MCRNIKLLFHFEPPTTPDEIRAASLQYVRKVSGTTRVSAVNQDVFERAVREVAESTERLLRELVPHGPPRTREGEAAKAKIKWQRREKRIRDAS
ncbi:MAG: DUF2277 domain-containing protein [Polyangiaceae bacterium]